MKNTAKIAQAGVLTALAFMLTLFKIPVWFAPPFYKLDFSEVITLFSGFLLGPFYGALIEFLKIFLKIILRGTATVGIGEFADFIIGCSLILPSAIFFKNQSKYNLLLKNDFKSIIHAMCIGTSSMIITAVLLNGFLVLPFYCHFAKVNIEHVVHITSKVNPLVHDQLSFALFAVLPFNLLKGILSSILCFLLYKNLLNISWLKI